MTKQIKCIIAIVIGLLSTAYGFRYMKNKIDRGFQIAMIDNGQGAAKQAVMNESRNAVLASIIGYLSMTVSLYWVFTSVNILRNKTSITF